MREQLNELLEKRIFNHKECVLKIEKLAEKQSIDFVKWIDKNYYQGEDYNTYAKCMDDFKDKDKIFTIKQLFETFKHESR